MPRDPRRPISILIAALGGQGGGVLTEWIVAAADHAGHAAQSTSIPGVAQRTGATTYYIEVAPAPRESGAPDPVFSLSPTPGDVDVIIASEWLEAGRTLELDLAAPDRTVLIASTHRLYAIGEKSVPGDGTFPADRIRDAVQALTRRALTFDGLAAARHAHSEVNAVLLGALSAAGVLPIPESAFEAAVAEGGVAVERSLAGLKAGRELVALGGEAADAPRPRRGWAELRRERAAALGRRGGDFLALAARAEADFPAALHETLGEAIARLIDYQDARHVEGFLGRVRALHALDPEGSLTRAFARRLAVWMTYEDVIRVADLKTRRGRFERIGREHAGQAGATLVVTDYLKPDLDELYGILPAALARPIAGWAERRWPQGRPTLAQHVRTTTVLGFLRVWLLGRLRCLRRHSLRYARESALMDRWERAVREAAALDRGLALEVAELAAVVKGYGAVRRRLFGALAGVLDETLPATVEVDRRAGAGYSRSTAIVRERRLALLSDEEASSP